MMNAGWLNRLIYRNFYRKVYRWCTAVHYPTEFIREVFETATHPTPAHVISNGVNPLFLEPRKNVTRPAEYEDKFVVLCSGRYSQEKAQHVLIEAAKLDGSSEWQIFKDICLPQCRSALYSIAILVFIDYWNMVEQPLILLPDASQQPLSVYLSQINAGEIGIAFAAAVIYMVPGLLMFLHGEDYLVEGIAHQGSVKG